MGKGTPWPVEEEKQLRDSFNSGTKDVKVLALGFNGKYSENAVYQKLLDLGLLQKEEERGQGSHSSSTNATIKLPDELPSIEETLKTLAGALEALKSPVLEKLDVLRFRTIILGAKIYKELLADYIDYRALEAELVELRAKYEELAKKTTSSIVADYIDYRALEAELVELRAKYEELAKKTTSSIPS